MSTKVADEKESLSSIAESLHVLASATKRDRKFIPMFDPEGECGYVEYGTGRKLFLEPTSPKNYRVVLVLPFGEKSVRSANVSEPMSRTLAWMRLEEILAEIRGD